MPAETHSHRQPLGAVEVEELVRATVAEVLAVDDAEVVPAADLRADLGADDLAVIALAEALEVELGEREVGFHLDDDDLAELTTVGDLLDALRARLAPGGDPAPASAPPSAVAGAAAPSSGRPAPGAGSGVSRDGSSGDDRVPSAGPAGAGVPAPPTAATDALAPLERALGVTIEDRALLLRSLAHRSWCGENGDSDSNERMEFLGDSVLGLVVTHYVYERYPQLPEGQLSEVRAGVVNSRVLAEVAAELDLGHHLLLGKGEDTGGGREKQSILADALEAVIAAVYLDQGWSGARALVLRCLEDRIRVAAEGPGGRDSKTRLQEVAAQQGLGRPKYAVRDEGPDHAKQFFAVVHLEGVAYGDGEGRSKKEAEQAAAFAAWRRLEGGAGPSRDGFSPAAPVAGSAPSADVARAGDPVDGPVPAEPGGAPVAGAGEVRAAAGSGAAGSGTPGGAGASDEPGAAGAGAP